MSKVKWIKIETDIITNRKIMELRDMKNGNDRVLLWFYLIILAGRCNDNGKVYFAQGVPYDEAKLQRELGISKVIVKSSLDYFQDNAMIELDSNGIITLIGWNEYQNADALEKQRESNRIRQQRWQENNKKNNALPNANITPSKCYINALDVDVELELEVDKKEEEIITHYVRKESDGVSEKVLPSNLPILNDDEVLDTDYNIRMKIDESPNITRQEQLSKLGIMPNSIKLNKASIEQLDDQQYSKLKEWVISQSGLVSVFGLKSKIETIMKGGN